MLAGLRKTSLVDYPGRVASALFLPGCGLRCPWCHNRDLVLGVAIPGLVDLDEALRHIKKRRPVLGGAVISGGEPTLYSGLPSLIATIKSWGLAVKLDTNGMSPQVLKTLFSRKESRPDYIALDLKLPPRRYRELLSGEGDGPFRKILPAWDPGEALEQSAALIHSSGIPHEFRTLALPRSFLTSGDIAAMADLADDGPWHFRPFKPGNCLDPDWNDLPEPLPEETESLAQAARGLGKNAAALGKQASIPPVDSRL